MFALDAHRCVGCVVVMLLLAGCTSAGPTASTPASTPTQPATPTASSAPTTVEPSATPATPVKLVPRNVSFETEDGATIDAELYGSGPTAVIFSVMGNCKQGWPSIAQAAAEQGLQTLTYQWRGCKTDPNNVILLKHFVDDTRAAIAYMRAQGANRIILVGASLGGCASAALANEAGVIGLVVVASPQSIPQWDFQVRADSLAGDIPKLFMIATDDSVVDPADARALYELAAEPKEWQTYPGSAHGTDLLVTGAGPEMRERILAFLRTTAG